MNIKTTVNLPEHLVRYAEKMVEDGIYPSIDSVLAASMEDMMQSKPPADVLAAVDKMADELRRRMALPDDQWLPWDEGSLVERIRKRRAEERSRNAI